jgi:hypothetical protein
VNISLQDFRKPLAKRAPAQPEAVSGGALFFFRSSSFGRAKEKEQQLLTIL